MWSSSRSEFSILANLVSTTFYILHIQKKIMSFWYIIQITSSSNHNICPFWTKKKNPQSFLNRKSKIEPYKSKGFAYAIVAGTMGRVYQQHICLVCSTQATQQRVLTNTATFSSTFYLERHGTYSHGLVWLAQV